MGSTWGRSFSLSSALPQQQQQQQQKQQQQQQQQQQRPLLCFTIQMQWVPQRGEMDCGLACAQMILKTLDSSGLSPQPPYLLVYNEKKNKDSSSSSSSTSPLSSIYSREDSTADADSDSAYGAAGPWIPRA
ncbi:uncharacterized protein EMH_0034740 [Eimeria mitis]|uniref:Uncharacterized protein n=1 Tax=Eimeria mitis TaxID=44415 RepID=U6JW85_9EIME|nr:uncharacterized protein EMH_0034740 [Eimeria mitis]CDJ27778.1 hypothetical protein, conserved [Eimeria mitis]